MACTSKALEATANKAQSAMLLQNGAADGVGSTNKSGRQPSDNSTCVAKITKIGAAPSRARSFCKTFENGFARIRTTMESVVITRSLSSPATAPISFATTRVSDRYNEDV